MKRTLSFFLAAVLILSVSSMAMFAYADNIELEAKLAKKFQQAFFTSSDEWEDTGENRAYLSLCLCLDACLDEDVSDLFSVQNLSQSQVYMLRTDEKANRFKYEILIHENYNVLGLEYYPESQEASYFVSKDISDAVFGALLDVLKDNAEIWEVESDDLDSALQTFKDALVS